MRQGCETEGKKALTTLIIYSNNNTYRRQERQVDAGELSVSYDVVLCLGLKFTTSSLFGEMYVFFHGYSHQVAALFFSLCSEFEVAYACLDCLYNV